MQIGIACLLVFLFMALLMCTRRISALLALPIMAIVIAMIGGVPANDILRGVISEGAVKLNNTYTTTMFGAVLAELLNKHGIAKMLIRWVAEFAGDNPFILAVVLTAVTALLFSTLGGLGAVIMVGTIVLPVMLSLGVSNVTAGSLFLFGISLGGMFNIAGWRLYMDVLNLKQPEIIAFVLPFACIVALLVVAFITVELRSWKNIGYFALASLAIACGYYGLSHRQFQAVQAQPAADPNSLTAAFVLLVLLSLYAAVRHARNATTTPGFSVLTPILPLILVLAFNWEFIPAFVAGIVFCTLVTWKHSSVTLLTRSIIDGINSVVPAVVLMIGIGMLIKSVSHPAVTGAIAPILKAVVPTRAPGYIMVFTAIAPLALYRGPLSLWGMGSGLVSLVQKSTALSSSAIMGMLMSVGQLQGICDPTNTANIWIATYLGTDTLVLLRKTIPYAWLGTICGLTMATLFGYVRF